jgi:hypothetical protein
MKSLTHDFISVGVANARENTWANRYRDVTPNIIKKDTEIELRTDETICSIDSFDEIVLTVILKFLFCPVWLVEQFYQAGKMDNSLIDGMNIAQDSVAREKIKQWKNVGLVWQEASVTGEYLRPTAGLFDLFGTPLESFSSIPFNTLTHTISEEAVFFDIAAGRSVINSREKCLPRISELGFKPDKSGASVIGESDFRNPKLMTNEGLNELSAVNHTINEGIKNKDLITPELENFRFFVIAKKVDNTGRIRADYIFHLPDLCIPAPRNNGYPQSVAVEVELTNKRIAGYESTLTRYKDNNRYGSVYWLCSDPGTARSLKAAYQNIGGTGNCKMFIQEFQIPHPKF